jgi:hypothetical protein
VVKGVIERKRKKLKKKKKWRISGSILVICVFQVVLGLLVPPQVLQALRSGWGIFIDAYCTTRMTHGALTRREEKRRRGEEKRRAA